MAQLLTRLASALRRALPGDAGEPEDTRLVTLSDAPLIYAVGDVHGMADLLDRLLDAIAADADVQGRPGHVIVLGDMVNRGPQTRRVLDRLVAGPRRPRDRWTVLRGNHEQAMLDGLAGIEPGAFERWLSKGGLATLRSYGPVTKAVTRDEAVRLVDPAHRRFLEGLPLYHLEGDLLFVHAGVKPKVPLAEQSPRAFLTMRGAFLKRPHGLPYTIVHGHTPTHGRPTLAPGRVNVDTGAYETGRLTAAVFAPETATIRFLQVARRKAVG